MAHVSYSDESEIILSSHDERRWSRRDEELSRWVVASKSRLRAKQTVCFGGNEIDAELLSALMLLKRLGIETEYSCAGVSPLDEPEDHSLYAYITLLASPRADAFARLAMKRMKHRLLVTYEPGRHRYDLSSFYIGHNRSFCLLMESCARVMLAAGTAAAAI
ncbi:hypothetical protein PA598K_06796 [Paenibacillus sp. 598K]|uniref:hypothetical protein n=1 Tax=Paenibacillus sp. 598K TaxID=1117987 RepID=UPI000FF9E2DB|nr:hypothetical protein [Paenibacillus sp. 598K]GBF78186.1 hypothetical protein PA598K_06796 [Paenibacillus sp. 598K]